MIQAQALAKRFGATEALRGVDLTIAAGEVLAIMGPSGSGKSTLLHCIAGVLVPDEGSVTFNGARIDQLSDGQRSELRRTKFGFIFQFGQLIPELSAIENAALPPLLNGLSRHEAETQAGAWFGRLGLSGLENRRAGELSGGQAQRVAIARAMVTRPRVIFADEPTGSLDSLAGEQVMDLLTASAREEGVAVVLVTHEPRVAAYADREIVVRDGRISSDGGRLSGRSAFPAKAALAVVPA